MNKKVYLVLGLLTLVLLAPFLMRWRESAKIFTVEAVPSAPVAIVFGAGLNTSGRPSDVLFDRLTVAAQLYAAGKVDKILLSGDNSFENYNEPDAMREAIQRAYSIPDEDIVTDYAGRRTYDTCARAHQIWQVDEAILVTQAFHLPRALFLCSGLGIQSTGVSASLQPYVYDRYFSYREYLAQQVAWLNLYIWAPPYIKGPVEGDL